MNIKEEIIAAIKQTLAELTKEKVSFSVEEPQDESFGDYSSNVALILFANSKVKGQNSKLQLKTQKWGSPMESAEEIVGILNTKYLIHNTNIDRVEAVKPGFINFHLSQEYLSDKLQEISNKKNYGGGESLRDKKIMVEFTDPNPFKEFHIGHLYSNTVGEAVSRLLEFQGADLRRANYQGDVGMHVAKALYGLLNSKLKTQNSKLEEKSLKERIKIMGESYAFGAKDYENSEVAKKEIEELNKKIYAKDEAVMGLYEKGRQWSLEYFETIYKRLGMKFDFYYFESEVGNDGLKLAQEYLIKGIFEKSQGAVIFPGKKENLHDRVFINSMGLPTYEAKELGLAFKKYQDFKFDQSIMITGNEIIGYFKVLIAAINKINPDLAGKMKHLPHGMVRLPSGKMSSRSGNIVTGEWLLDEAKKLLQSKFPEMTDEVLEKVTIGAVKYALLKSSLGHDIEFNFEESINIQGNSGPYLQYVYARTQSVLNKCHPELVSGSPAGRQAPLRKEEMLKQVQHDKPLENEEMSLLRSLSKFPEVVESVARNFAPNILCNYLFDLAQKYNLFYQKHKIIGSEQEDFRLKLTAGIGQVIQSGLKLLGIESPEKM